MVTSHYHLASVLLALALPAVASAEEVVWRAARPAPSRPAASLGAPVPLARPAPAVIGRVGTVVRARAPDPDPPSPAPWPPPPPPAATVDPLKPGGEIGKPSLPDLSVGPKTQEVWQPPTDLPPPDNSGIDVGVPVTPGFGERMRGWFNVTGPGQGGFLCADPCANEAVVSPITAPFYFEDPRALQEVRPIFTYQSVPSKSLGWGGGGGAYFFGTQARLRLSERFSIVLHELGGVSFKPDNASGPIQDSTGFAEVKLGAKYTFLRNQEQGSAAAVGVMFEIPAGSDKVFQNTGDLSISPYLSYAQTLWRLPGSAGVLNVMGNMGYSFSTDKVRSEFFYTNFHIDYNVLGLNKFFPLFEVNWFYYTRSGNNVSLGYEGADLVNFGSTTTEGRSQVTLAAGLRYKFTENIIGGAAIQFPVTSEKGLQDYRLTFDVIFKF